eukprot:Rhum_TRINITY_DN14453_c0_g3::Rhum_TRINITY_DN14453_c0_g3_i1::g.87973::m.87973
MKGRGGGGSKRITMCRRGGCSRFPLACRSCSLLLPVCVCCRVFFPFAFFFICSVFFFFFFFFFAVFLVVAFCVLCFALLVALLLSWSVCVYFCSSHSFSDRSHFIFRLLLHPVFSLHRRYLRDDARHTHAVLHTQPERCASVVLRVRLCLREEGRQVGEVHRTLRQRLHHLEGVLVQVRVRRHVTLEVQPDRRTRHTRAGETEDDTRAVAEDPADALVRGHRRVLVHRVLVAEVVARRQLQALRAVRGGGTRLGHALRHEGHDLVRLLLVHSLVVVAGVVVASEGAPVLFRDLLHAHKRLARLVLRCEDLQPREHRPHAVLLAHVVGPRPERLLAAQERRVAGACREVAGVHQVAEELPARRRLEALDALRLSHAVERARRRHGPRAALQPAREAWDQRGVGRDDGERVRRRHEPLLAGDHVAVCVAVGGGAEVGARGAVADGATLLVEADGGDERASVGEVGVGVAVVGGVRAAEVFPALRVEQTLLVQAQLVDEDAARIRPLHAVHAVVHHREVLARHERLQRRKVEALLQDRDVVLRRVEHLNLHGASVALELRHADGRDVDRREVGEGLVRGDLLRVLEDQVRDLLRGRAAVLAVVLDAKVLVDAAGVVARRQDQSAEGHEAGAPGTDDGRHGRRRQETVLGDPDRVRPVRHSDPRHDLDRSRVVEAAVTRHHKGSALDRRLGVGQRVEGALREVLEEMRLHELARLLAEPGSAGLLTALDRRGRHHHRLTFVLAHVFLGRVRNF